MAKVLVIRFSSIGDIVVCTPVIRMLSTQLGAEVHLLTKEKYGFVLEDNPYISEIITIKKKIKEVKQKLLEEKYDLVIDLHKNLRSSQVKSMLNKPVYTFDKLNLARNLFVKTKINILPRKHIIDRHLEGLISLIKDDKKGMDYHINEDKLPSDIKATAKLKYVLLSLGASHFTKRMTPEVLNLICKNITQQIIIIGGNDTIELSKKINSQPNILNLVGKTSMRSSAYLAKNAEYIITGDSAMMHISAALDKKMLVVWGATSPLLGMGPHYKNENKHVELFQNIQCRPCTKQGTTKCPKKHFNCMNYSEIEIQNALDKIQ